MKTHAFAFLFSAMLLTPVLAQGKAAALTDANIIAIGAAAHQAEIDAAQIALGTSTNPDVKMFAEQMVTDHSAALAKATALASKLSVPPDDNDDVAALAEEIPERSASSGRAAPAARQVVAEEAQLLEACSVGWMRRDTPD